MLKQKFKCPPQMMPFRGSTGLASGMSQENQTSSTEDVDLVHNTDELRASPNALHPRV